MVCYSDSILHWKFHRQQFETQPTDNTQPKVSHILLDHRDLYLSVPIVFSRPLVILSASKALCIPSRGPSITAAPRRACRNRRSSSILCIFSRCAPAQQCPLVCTQLMPLLDLCPPNERLFKRARSTFFALKRASFGWSLSLPLAWSSGSGKGTKLSGIESER